MRVNSQKYRLCSFSVSKVLLGHLLFTPLSPNKHLPLLITLSCLIRWACIILIKAICGGAFRKAHPIVWPILDIL